MAIDLNKQHQTQIFIRATIILIIISAVLILISINQDNSMWLSAFIPILLCLCITPKIFEYLIDSAQPKLGEDTRRVVYFTLYNSLATTAAFFILLALKLEGTLTAGWGFVYIPLWYGLGIYFGFICFLIPKMLNKLVNRKRQASMLVLWFLAITTSSVFHVLYLETSFPTELCIVLSPMLISGFIHLILFLVPVIQAKLDPQLPKINLIGVDFLWAGFTISTIVIILLKLMVAEVIPTFVIFIPLAKVLIILTVQSEKHYTKIKKEGYEYINS